MFLDRKLETLQGIASRRPDKQRPARTGPDEVSHELSSIERDLGRPPGPPYRHLPDASANLELKRQERRPSTRARFLHSELDGAGFGACRETDANAAAMAATSSSDDSALRKGVPCRCCKTSSK